MISLLQLSIRASKFHNSAAWAYPRRNTATETASIGGRIKAYQVSMWLCFFYLLTILDLFVCLSIWSLFLCISVCLSVCDYLNAVSVSLPCTHSSSFIILETTIWAVAQNKSFGWKWYGISAVRVRDKQSKRVVYPMKLDSWPGNCEKKRDLRISISMVDWLDPIIGVYCLPCIYSGLVSWPTAFCHRCHKFYQHTK